MACQPNKASCPGAIPEYKGHSFIGLSPNNCQGKRQKRGPTSEGDILGHVTEYLGDWLESPIIEPRRTPESDPAFANGDGREGDVDMNGGRLDVSRDVNYGLTSPI